MQRLFLGLPQSIFFENPYISLFTEAYGCYKQERYSSSVTSKNVFLRFVAKRDEQKEKS
jgi:hypothetical protein